MGSACSINNPTVCIYFCRNVFMYFTVYVGRRAPTRRPLTQRVPSACRGLTRFFLGACELRYAAWETLCIPHPLVDLLELSQRWFFRVALAVGTGCPRPRTETDEHMQYVTSHFEKINRWHICVGVVCFYYRIHFEQSCRSREGSQAMWDRSEHMSLCGLYFKPAPHFHLFEMINRNHSTYIGTVTTNNCHVVRSSEICLVVIIIFLCTLFIKLLDTIYSLMHNHRNFLHRRAACARPINQCQVLHVVMAESHLNSFHNSKQITKRRAKANNRKWHFTAAPAMTKTWFLSRVCGRTWPLCLKRLLAPREDPLQVIVLWL